MICSNCGHEASPDAKFCTYCGTALEDATAWAGRESAEADDLQGVVAGLRAQIDRLQSQVDRQTQRIYALENARPGPAPVTPASATTGRTAVPAEASVGAAPASAIQQGAPTSAPPDSERTDPFSGDWEWLLGGNWLARIGILAVIIGVGLFLKLAFDNEWIGETGRVVLGLAVGVALLGGGEFWARRYPAWAQAVTGGGIAILYLSVFAAYVLYSLVPVAAALGLSSLVTLAAACLALRYESRTVAVLGILGGFATPLFLADKLPGQWALLVYVLVLDLGVLALATFRNWRWFTLLALFGSLALFAFWHEELNPSLLLAQVGITVIFLIFVGATTLFHLLWRRTPELLDQSLIVLNGMAYFGISYLLMFDAYRAWMGGFTLLLALFYGLLGYGILIRHREQVQLSLFTLGMAPVFLTIAIPVQFGGPWVTIAWAVQAAVLVWLSFFHKMHQLRWAGMAVFALIVFWLVGYDFATSDRGAAYFGDGYSYWPVANWYFLAFAAAVAAMYLSAYFTWRWRDRYFYPWDIYLTPALLVAANGLTLFALSVEIFNTVDRGFFDIAPDIAGNVTSLSLSALWALYAAGLIVLGIVRPNRWLRLAGLGLLAVPVVKLFAYDVFSLGQVFRVTAFIGLGALLVVGGFLYQRYGRVIRGVLLD